MNECEHFIRDPFVRSLVIIGGMIVWTWIVYSVGIFAGARLWPK